MEFTNLLCSKCDTLLSLEKNVLKCPKCGNQYNKLSSGYFDFRPGGSQPDQERGLKSHMEVGFYCNDKFQNFLSDSNLEHLKKALVKIDHKKILDIGCSNGCMFEAFNGCEEYYGFDPSDISSISNCVKKDSVFLVHNDVERSFPVKEESMDGVTLFASYDHLPAPAPVIKDAWSKIKPGGFLLINMTNYGFWLKALINKISGKRLFKNEHEHFCVHDPKTLEKEVGSFIDSWEVVDVDSDFVYLPNLPKKISWMYFNQCYIRILNRFAYFLFHKLLRMKNRGSLMTVVFRKLK
jgi:SAM-dependent methyltransferase